MLPVVSRRLQVLCSDEPLRVCLVGIYAEEADARLAYFWEEIDQLHGDLDAATPAPARCADGAEVWAFAKRTELFLRFGKHGKYRVKSRRLYLPPIQAQTPYLLIRRPL
jgi:hypothetical protein